MPASQRLLFADPRPLVERLGREFFWGLPESPGVYLMHDAADTVVYVGKARNLRKRLNSYRVANPERLARRHLRLLHTVTRIELQGCPDEAAALTREAELLRALKPKFNRAGTWPAPPRFLAWRCAPQEIELAVVTVDESAGPRTVLSANPCFWTIGHADMAVRAPEGFQHVGPLGAGAFFLRAALARLIRLGVCPERGFAAIPAGWLTGKFAETARIDCPTGTSEIPELLACLFAGNEKPLCDWFSSQIHPNKHPFEQAIIAADLEILNEFSRRITTGKKRTLRYLNRNFKTQNSPKS